MAAPIAGGAAAGAAAAAANAVVAPIVVVDPKTLLKLLPLEEEPILVEVPVKEGVLRRRTAYIYLAGIRGLTFAAKSAHRLNPSGAVKIVARKLVAPPALRASL